MNRVLELRNVNFAYPGAPPVLQNFNWSLERNAKAVLLGPNGSGKTTIFRLLSGLEHPTSGEARMEGKSVASYSATERARKLAVLTQGGFFTQSEFSVREIVSMGRLSHRKLWEFESAYDRECVEKTLHSMALADLAKRPFNTLSGGEKQRTMLAAALVQEPEILLLDEPTSALDMGREAELMALLESLRQSRPLSLVLVTHNVALAGRFADCATLLKNGQILAEGTPEEVLREELLGHAYSRPCSVHRPGEGTWMVSCR